MLWLVLAMTIAVVLAALVVAVVALPARRAGRFVLTPRGEKAFRVADERARAARTLATRRGEHKGESSGSAEAKKNDADKAGKDKAGKRVKDSPAKAAPAEPVKAETSELAAKTQTAKTQAAKAAAAPRRRRLSRSKK